MAGDRRATRRGCRPQLAPSRPTAAPTTCSPSARRWRCRPEVIFFLTDADLMTNNDVRRDPRRGRHDPDPGRRVRPRRRPRAWPAPPPRHHHRRHLPLHRRHAVPQVGVTADRLPDASVPASFRGSSLPSRLRQAVVSNPGVVAGRRRSGSTQGRAVGTRASIPGTRVVARPTIRAALSESRSFTSGPCGGIPMRRWRFMATLAIALACRGRSWR